MTTTTPRPARIVDAHVHLWDPARTDWYPYLSGRTQLDMGDVSGISRHFDVPTYLAESAGWNVEKLVNVAAAECSDGRKLVLPGQPATSYLVEKLMGVNLCFGTQMPKAGSIVTAEVQTIANWICEGAPNN